MRIFRRMFIFILICGCAISPTLFAYQISQNSYTSQKEQKLGKQFFQMIQAQLPILSDPLVNDYIQTLGFQLVSHSPKPSKHFEFFVIRDPSMNAFTCPDGYIGINSGTILKTHSEDELAAVLAHEIAHATQQHIMRSIEKQQKLQLSSIAAMLAGAVVATQNPQAGAGIMAASQAGSYQGFLNYSRDYEKEADRIGIQILAAAGFNPEDFPELLKRMTKEERLNDLDVSQYLRSHPLTETRLSDMENRAANLKSPPPKIALAFHLIQARCAADLGSNKPQEFMRRLRAQLHEHSTMTLQYTYALAAQNAHEYKIALLTIKELIKKYPSQIILKMSLADIQTDDNKIKEAEKTLRTLYFYNPDYYPLLLQYGYFLLTTNQASKATNMLESYQSEYSHDIRFLALLSQAQGKSNQLSKGYQTRAEVYLLLDNKKAAVQQLKMALQFAKNNFDKTKIDAKIKISTHETN